MLKRAEEKLLENEESQQQTDHEDDSLPHGKYDLWCDGAAIFQSSEQASDNVIMAKLHSWKSS